MSRRFRFTTSQHLYASLYALRLGGSGTGPRALAVDDFESDFEHNLVVSHFIVDDVTAHLRHFEPLHILDRLAALGQGILYGILYAAGGRSDNFNLLVGVMISHWRFILSLPAKVPGRLPSHLQFSIILKFVTPGSSGEKSLVEAVAWVRWHNGAFHLTVLDLVGN
jgi:hypothetical protein